MTTLQHFPAHHLMMVVGIISNNKLPNIDIIFEFFSFVQLTLLVYTVTCMNSLPWLIVITFRSAYTLVLLFEFGLAFPSVVVCGCTNKGNKFIT